MMEQIVILRIEKLNESYLKIPAILFQGLKHINAKQSSPTKIIILENLLLLSFFE